MYRCTDVQMYRCTDVQLLTLDTRHLSTNIDVADVRSNLGLRRNPGCDVDPRVGPGVVGGREMM